EFHKEGKKEALMKHTRLGWWLLISVLPLIWIGTSCSHKQALPRTEAVVKDKLRDFSLYVVWIKNKGDSIDALVEFNNHTESVVTIDQLDRIAVFNKRRGQERTAEALQIPPRTTMREVQVWKYDDPKLPKKGNLTI